MEMIKSSFDKVVTQEQAKNFLTKEDAKQFLTKEDAKQFLTKEDAKQFLTKDDKEELMRHMSAAVEIILEEIKGADRDEMNDVKQKQRNHEQRISSLEVRGV